MYYPITLFTDLILTMIKRHSSNDIFPVDEGVAELGLLRHPALKKPTRSGRSVRDIFETTIVPAFREAVLVTPSTRFEKESLLSVP